MAECSCIYKATDGTKILRLVWRDPICAQHYEPVPQYNQRGERRPIDDSFPDGMKVG